MTWEDASTRSSFTSQRQSEGLAAAATSSPKDCMGLQCFFDWFPLLQIDRSMMVLGRNGRFLRADRSASSFNPGPDQSISLSALPTTPRLVSMSAVEVVCDPKSAWQIEVLFDVDRKLQSGDSQCLGFKGAVGAD